MLDDLLRKHKPLGVVDHAPFYDVTLVMSFGDDQGSSKDYVHPIGFAYGERALAAFRVVSKTAKGFQVISFFSNFPNSIVKWKLFVIWFSSILQDG